MMEEQKKMGKGPRSTDSKRRHTDKNKDNRKIKGSWEDNKNSRWVVVQLAETESEIGNIEDRIMTDGTLGLDKENKLLKKRKLSV